MQTEKSMNLELRIFIIPEYKNKESEALLLNLNCHV